MRDGGDKGGDVKRNLFTPVSVVTAVLCAASAIAYMYILTLNVIPFGPGPASPSEEAWFGWSCTFFAFLTFGLLLWRAHLIRRSDERERSGLCPHCGYDLRGMPDRCPECGAEPPVSWIDLAEPVDHPRRQA
jgi:hypothetical protein